MNREQLEARLKQWEESSRFYEGSYHTTQNKFSVTTRQCEKLEDALHDSKRSCLRKDNELAAKTIECDALQYEVNQLCAQLGVPIRYEEK